MIVHQRSMKSESESIFPAFVGQGCQASLNSDGHLTLRLFEPDDKKNDKIVVFSEAETKAIVDLFREIASIKRDELPF